MVTVMMRVLLLVLLAGFGVARASEKIDAPAEGASAAVSQPHVTAELIPEMTTVQTGKPFGVILHLHMDAGWHTYWVNPGDAGLATTIKWTLPAGFTAGPILWPVPEKHSMGPLMTYGYEGDAYLLTMITPPASGELPEHVEVKAKAEWLVCKEECIPGKGEFSLSLDTGLMNFRLPVTNSELFKEARGRLPVANRYWNVKGEYKGDSLILNFQDFISAAPATENAYFFPEQGNVLNAVESKPPIPASHALADFSWTLALQQNGEKPDKLSGVLVIDSQSGKGGSDAFYISEFPVGPKGPPTQTGGTASSGYPDAEATTYGSSTLVIAPSSGTNAAPVAGANAAEPGAGTAAGTNAPTSLDVATLLGFLGAAFVGGLILNLMPCVLPVLSLKVFSLIKHAGEHPEKAWRQGAAFTAGVVISFWVLAGALLTLRAAGNQIGWGFQMQSPGFVAAMIVLFFLIGLNLFGVFEIGTSLVGVDAKAAQRSGGGASSFLNGALATLAATPCTAPFMGSALGFAAQQPAYVSMLIFTFLALGMAAPYLLLTIFPQALRFVPKPGAWMESLKQFMGFLLMGTVVWFLPTFGALTNASWLGWMLFALLFIALGAWMYGRFGITRTLIYVPLAGLALYVLRPIPDTWQEWSPEAVQAALKSGQPVFVDFTAAWCLSCKVNERVALETEAVKKAFADKKVALFRADWTHADPRISQTLQQYKRDGVPLYLLYSPQAPDAPQVLPEVLTPGIVLGALGKI